MAVNKELAQKTFDEWRKGARIRSIAHQRAGDFYGSWAKTLGVLVATFSAIVGASIFTSLLTSKDQPILIVVGLISLSAAVISGTNSFLNLPQLAAKHTEVGLAFGEVRRRIDVIDCLECDDATTEKNLTEIETAYNKALKDAPTFPARFYDKAEKKVEAVEHK